MGLVYPFLQHMRNEPILAIVLKLFYNGFDSLSGNAFTKSMRISRGLIEVFYSLRILSSTSPDAITGITGQQMQHYWGGREYYMREEGGFVQ